MPRHVKTPPSGEPVTLDEAKAQLNLEVDEDDELLIRCIGAAREHVESHCNRGVLEQTIELVLDAFPTNFRHPYQLHTCGLLGYPGFSGFPVLLPCRACELFIELPFGKLATTPALEVKYIDTTGAQQTLVEDTDYVVDAVSVPGRLFRAFGKSWPQTRVQWDAVRVSYVVGWKKDEVPQAIKQAVLLLVSQMYEHRAPEIDTRFLTSVKFSYESLLSPFRIITL